MGYQESYIHTTCSNVEKNNSDIEKFIEIFKKHDVRCQGDWLARCAFKLHFNKTISKYKKGMDVLVVTGERQAQRNCFVLFDCDRDYDEGDMTPHYSDEEMQLIKRAKITFLEEEPQVWYEKEHGTSIDIEELILLPELPSNYEKISSIVQNIFNKILDYVKSIGLDIDNIHNYDPQNKEELDIIIDIFKSEIENAGYLFEYKKSEEMLDDERIRYEHKLYMNNVCIAECSYLPWNERYVLFLYKITGQLLRQTCNLLLVKDNK